MKEDENYVVSVAFLKMVPDCCSGCGGCGGPGPESVPRTELCVLDESGVDDGDAAAAAADGSLQDHCDRRVGKCNASVGTALLNFAATLCHTGNLKSNLSIMSLG